MSVVYLPAVSSASKGRSLRKRLTPRMLNPTTCPCSSTRSISASWAVSRMNPGASLFLRCGGRPCRRCRGAGRRHDDAGSERKLFHRGYAGHVVSRLTEAGGRQADLFFIVKGDALAHNLVQLAGDRVVPHSEIELLRRGAWH